MFSNHKPELNINGSWGNKYMYIYHTCNSILLNVYIAAWYTGDLKELMDEALVTGNDLLLLMLIQSTANQEIFVLAPTVCLWLLILAASILCNNTLSFF